MVVAGGLVEASGDASKVLEFAEAAFDEVTLGVEVSVERVFAGVRGIVWYDGQRACARDLLAQGIGVIRCIGDNDFGRQIGNQWTGGLRCIAGLPGCSAAAGTQIARSRCLWKRAFTMFRIRSRRLS